ncbi:hypothetical protein AB9N12_04635 [Bacteroides sp. AN502(2024)]|uniref:hypothetical protein n=1 Tax=Bacteroides sp. AN502(2024) TaxID=3160599 RepID=UPI0035186147
MKKLYLFLIFSKLLVFKALITIITVMHDFIVKFGKMLDIFKEFAENRVDKNGNHPHCGVVPKFSDWEVTALSTIAEAFGFDSENYLFKRLHAEKGDVLPNLITRRQYNQRKLTARSGKEIPQGVATAEQFDTPTSVITASLLVDFVNSSFNLSPSS